MGLSKKEKRDFVPAGEEFVAVFKVSLLAASSSTSILVPDPACTVSILQNLSFVNETE